MAFEEAGVPRDLLAAGVYNGERRYDCNVLDVIRGEGKAARGVSGKVR